MITRLLLTLLLVAQSSLVWAQAGGQFVQIRGGSAVNIAALTPAAREILFDTTNLRLVLGDGATLGGAAIIPNLAAIQAAFAPLSHAHAATDITSATMATARLGSGTANGTTFLRGDSTWATVDLTPYLTIASAASTYQPLDSDLTAIAALTTTSFGRGLLDDADATAGRVSLAVVIGTNVQAYDADLTTYAGITPAANVQSLLGAADYSAMRTLLGLVIGTNVQAYDADLTTYAGIAPSSNVQSLLAAVNYADVRSQLGLVVGADVQARDLDLDEIAAISDVRGDILVANSTPAWSRLAVGAAGTVLIGGTDPSYSATPSVSKLTATLPSAGQIGIVVKAFDGTADVLLQFQNSNAAVIGNYERGVGWKLSDAQAYRVYSGSISGNASMLFNNQKLWLPSGAYIAWTSSATDAEAGHDTFIYRDAANTLALRNAANAQAFRNYNTWTDASNGEWATFNWASNVFHIGATKNGTGTARVMSLDFGGTTTSAISIPIASGTITFGGPVSATLFVSTGTAPAVSNTSANSCGTTAATLTGTDTTGVITVGATAGTDCTITFTVAAANRRECWANNATTGNLARHVYTDTTHSKVQGTFVAGDLVEYGCLTY